MKNITAFCLSFLLSGVFALTASESPREIFWENALEIFPEKPKDAVAAFDEIALQCAQAEAWDEYALALCMRATARARIEGRDGSVAVVRELQRAVDEAPSAESRAFLSARLAYALRELAESLRFGQMRPSTPIADTAEKDNGDVSIWSRKRIASEALNAYKRVFADAEILKKIPVATFAAKKTESKKIQALFGGHRGNNEFGLFSLRDSPAADFPTLYDFFAQDAVKFYGFFAEHFDTAENARRELLETWKNFHANDADKSAYARAIFSGFSPLDEDYEAKLKNFTKEFSYYPIAAEAFAQLARNAIADERREEAFLFAKEGYEKYRQHKNSGECGAILNSMTAENLGIFRTKSAWFDAESAQITLKAKNVGKIHFRAVPWDWQDFLRRERNRPENLSKAECREILLCDEGAITWSQDLEKFTDFAEHEFTVPAPFEKFSPGFYFITASADPNFKSFGNDRMPYLTVWVSDIAAIAHKIPWQGENTKIARTLRGYVVNARTGEPLENVEIAAWNKVYGGDRVPVESVKSAADGSFELPGLNADFVALAVAPDGNAVSIPESISYSSAFFAGKPDSDIGKLFTDRAIYRPGQLIHFKGIRARCDADVPGSEKVLPGEKVEVKLLDANNEEVAVTECYTNAFGSFAGTFTAPAGLLKGEFTLEFDAVECSISVEKYKRPKFEVSISRAEKQSILGQTVEMLVNARAFTGMSLDNARIVWSVTEQTRDRFSYDYEENVVAHGEGEPDADGTFKIAFPTEVKKLPAREARKLSPTEKLKRERDLSRAYLLNVAVTDASGETREQEKLVRIGNCGVTASLSFEYTGWSVSLRDCDENPIAVPATLSVYEAVLPEKIGRDKLYPRKEDMTRGKKLFEKQFVSDATANYTRIEIPQGALPESGAFIAVLSGTDAFSRPFECECYTETIGGNAAHYPVKIPFIADTKQQETVMPGETFSVAWGSGYESARARIEIMKNGGMLKTFWTQKGNTQETINIPVTRELVGGFRLRITQFRDGNMYGKEFLVAVPEADKNLKVEWQRFRTNLIPGGAEVWTARVTLPDGTPANAEMLALLYDRSLDGFCRNRQMTGPFMLPVFDKRNHNTAALYASNRLDAWFSSTEAFPKGPYSTCTSHETISWILPWIRLAHDYRLFSAGAVSGEGGAVQAVAVFQSADRTVKNKASAAPEAESTDAGDATSREQRENFPVAPRKNLQETAFFQPFISTDANGVAQITFVVPEALTGWRFIAFAHDKALRSGSLESDAITTQKPLMAQPDAPRFLREGDSIKFPVKISNSGTTPLRGNAQIAFSRADNGKDVFAELCTESREKPFDVPAGATQTLMWEIRIPAGCEFLTYRATASAENFSDGEEALLPILPAKVTVTESANFLVRPGTERTETIFDPSVKINNLSIAVNDDPAWEAFLALPRLAMLARENDSSDSVFYRFYTNKLAEKIAELNPDYRRKFDALNALGNDSEAFRSPLEREKAKDIALAATPFVADAANETARRRTVAQLFEENTMRQETQIALETLRERLSELKGDGWSWFPGAQHVSPRITRTILLGLVRLRDIGALTEDEIRFTRPAFAYLDKIADEAFNRFDDKGNRIPAELNSGLAEWLYLRSRTRNYGTLSKAWNYYLGEARKPEIWTKLPRYSQAQIALTLQNCNPESPVPARIVESIRQHAIESEELGMHWKDIVSICPWCIEYASIETQAMMIELFAKVAKDEKAVSEMKIWLLTQKQAQAWQASRATAEAVYALLCTPESGNSPADGNEELSENEMRSTPSPEKTTQSAPQVFAGTQRLPAGGKEFVREEITSEHGKIQVKNPRENPVLVSAVWTYETEINAVSDNEAPSGFKIRKSLWKKAIDADGKKRLYPIRGETLYPGDEIVVRLVIEADRDFEFVRVKDFRASGCEPTGTRSGYRWNNAVWYYATTSDTAEEFFFDRLPQGKHVLEYSLRAVHGGSYSAGFAEIRSLYAPEFSAHSKSATLQTH